MASTPPIKPASYPEVGPRTTNGFVVKSGGKEIATISGDADGLAEYIKHWSWYNRNINAASELSQILSKALNKIEELGGDTREIKAALAELDVRTDVQLPL